MRVMRITLVSAMLLIAQAASATIFGSIRGIVHDPQHRPISGVSVTVKSSSSDWTKSGTTNANGEFEFNAIPLGQYSVTVSSPGFADASQKVTVNSGTQPVVHLALRVAVANETVTVSGQPAVAPTDSVTPTTIVSRTDIQRTPGAVRTNSLAMITDYTPGAYVTHDQLHIRGGHQTSWLIDGVPVPNTNIASNLGAQFDPKDIDYLEIQRGSYSAAYGDRTYGVFNIAPRTGFERNSEAEVILSAGNFYQTNDQFNFGSHTERFAYYVSLNGNRSDLGIQTRSAGRSRRRKRLWRIRLADFQRGPLESIATGDLFAQGLLPDPLDPIRTISKAIPVDGQYPTIGLRDGDHESDALVNFSWVHTFNSKLLLTVSPFFHYNSADYSSSPQDFRLRPRKIAVQPTVGDK